MTEGRGSNCFTVRICPRPFTTMSALPDKSRPTALRVVQILIGSKLALSTSTGSCILCLHNRQDYTADFLNSETTLMLVLWSLFRRSDEGSNRWWVRFFGDCTHESARPQWT